MKKILSMVIIFACLLSLCSCGIAGYILEIGSLAIVDNFYRDYEQDPKVFHFEQMFTHDSVTSLSGSAASICLRIFIQQAAWWCSLIVISSGISSRQIFIASSHRGQNAQPFGMFSMLIGVPEIGTSLSLEPDSRGILFHRPLVYSCFGL